MKQRAYEDALVYARRFREVAEQAYPNLPWHEQEERDIVHAFVRGLAIETMIEELALRIRPATLAEAVVGLSQLQAAAREYDMLSHKAGKRVSAVGGATPESTVGPTEIPGAGPAYRQAPPPEASSYATLERQLAKLSTKVGEIAAFSKKPVAAKNDPPKKSGQSRFNNSGPRQGGGPSQRPSDPTRKRGPCWCCGGEHLLRECTQPPPQASGHQQPTPRGPPPPQTNYQGNGRPGAYPSRR